MRSLRLVRRGNRRLSGGRRTRNIRKRNSFGRKRRSIRRNRRSKRNRRTLRNLRYKRNRRSHRGGFIEFSALPCGTDANASFGSLSNNNLAGPQGLIPQDETCGGKRYYTTDTAYSTSESKLGDVSNALTQEQIEQRVAEARAARPTSVVNQQALSWADLPQAQKEAWISLGGSESTWGGGGD
jgi:hypothetical protein